MKKSLLLLIAVVLQVFSFGCATATGPIFKEIPSQEYKGKAIVYFYRNSQIGFGADYDLKINGKVTLPLLNKGYYLLVLEPGAYKFEIFSNPETLKAENKFVLEADKTYFIRYWTEIAGERYYPLSILLLLGAPRGTPILEFGITLIPSEEALEVVKKCRLIEETAKDIGSSIPPEPIISTEATNSNIISNDTDTVTGMEFMFVKGGCYQMGDLFGDGFSNEKPVHEVCVDDFYIGKYLVTQGQWKAIRGNNPSDFSKCGNDCPVEQVSWNDAQEFIRIMNQRTGKTYRLLTEAEWEYAARSRGKKEKWAGANDDSQIELWYHAWYLDNAGARTHPVGQKKPNGLYIYDMTGNVWEWVQDIYSSDAYSHHSRNNPIYTGSGNNRVIRGGS
jgi:formylglycine-generating enzyme required for sulfatase activity